MPSRPQHLYEFGPFRLDTGEQLLLRDGKPVPLTPKAFEMLVALVERSGHLVEKEELMKVVWADAFVEEANLTNNVSALRKLLGQGKGGQNYIETVPKRGYRFTAAVRELKPETLVVERRSFTRVVTEETEEDVRNDSVTLTPATAVTVRPAPLSISSAPRARRMLLTVAVIVAVVTTTFGIYWLIEQSKARNRANVPQPFSAMDISRLTTSGKVTHSSISPNGKYVANIVKDTDGNSLWLKHVGVPSNVRLAGPAVTEYISVTFARDGNSIYYIALDHDKGVSTLYSVPTLGGPSTMLGDDIYPIGFSPDGNHMAFIRMRHAESTLVVADVNGSNQQVVAARREPDLFEFEWNAPAWSPDGKLIACPTKLHDQHGYFETLVSVNPNDGTQALLTSARWNYVGQPVWLPDRSGLLVTAIETEGSPMQVWHISLSDGIATRVTHDLNDYHDLSLTTDARQLAAVQVQAVSNIWVSESDGRAAKQISSEVGSLEVLAWTPDGQLVYRSSAGGNGPDIWIMRADGSNAKQLTVGARASRGLAVTPNGRHIIFVSDRAGQFNIWRVDTDGGNLRQLTAGDGEFYPHCCSDGQWVVFQHGPVDPKLWKVSIEGGELVQVTQTRATRAAVSPDGQMIAYPYLDFDLHPPRWGIGLVSSDGRRLKRFDFPPTVVYRAVRWFPDGQSIAFVNSPNGLSDIWLQPLDGSAPKPLTNFGAELILAFEWSPDGRSLAFVRNIETSDVVLIEENQK
jgi:Tol biopolymer transport system component/DNA-binding winged helix-turn-helix (wHTH) protein